MYKTILSMFAFFMFIGVNAQNLTNLEGTDDPVFITNSKVNACSFTNPSNAFEGGRGCSNANGWTVANDLAVNAGESFILKQISANILAETASTITSVDIFYYQDNAGIPGAQIGSQLGVVPTTQNVIGTAFGFDVKDVVLDVIQFGFTGQAGSSTTYWIGLSTYNNATGDIRNFWEDTSATAEGNPLAFDDGTGYTAPDPLKDGVYTYSGTCVSTCDMFNLSNEFENGRGCSAANGWVAANDLITDVNQSFLLQQLRINIFKEVGSTITSVDVFYYDDNAGLPNTQIGSQMGIVPSSQNVVGSNFGFDISEVVLDITPFVFTGSASSPKTYWVGITTTNNATADSRNFWEVTSASNVGNPLALDDNGAGYSIPDVSQDGVYIFVGLCSGLGVADAVIDGFSMYPNPVENTLTIKALNSIDAISVYNLLGQEVLKSTPSTTQVQMDMSELLTGAYIVKVQVGNQIASYSLIKQ